MELCDKIDQIVMSNWRGVQVYLKPIYKYYFGLFHKLIMPMVEKVWTENILPELGVSTLRALAASLRLEMGFNYLFRFDYAQ